MRRVLIVHYHFLPVHNVSVRRLVGYAKLLPDLGWQAVVLTRAWHALEEADPSWGLSWEPGIEDEARCVIHRVECPARPGARPGGRVAASRLRPAPTSGLRRPLRKLVDKAVRVGGMLFGDYPDEFVGWVRPAVAAGEGLARRDGIDLVMSYCPPESNHLVARALARRLGVPWVPFFGDLYGFLDPPLPAWSLERHARRAWHRWCLAPAAACAAVSPAMVDHLTRTYGKPTHLIHTGFDPEEFSGPDPAPDEVGNRLVVSHVGSVYPGDQRPEVFFDGLDRLLAGHPEVEERLEVRFVGSKCDDQLRSMLEGRPASRVCAVHPKVDSVTARTLVRSSDALLAFTCTAYRDRHGTLSYPTKIFEAFGARRPVLAVPADGDWVDALLSRAGGGRSARNADEVAEILLDWFRSWERDGHVPYHGRDEELAEFTRRRQVERLAGLFDSILGAARP